MLRYVHLFPYVIISIFFSVALVKLHRLFSGFEDIIIKQPYPALRIMGMISGVLNSDRSAMGSQRVLSSMFSFNVFV